MRKFPTLSGADLRNIEKSRVHRKCRGSQGGYQLIRPIESITIYDIIALMETNTSIVNTQDERDPMKRILMRESGL